MEEEFTSIWYLLSSFFASTAQCLQQILLSRSTPRTGLIHSSVLLQRLVRRPLYEISYKSADCLFVSGDSLNSYLVAVVTVDPEALKEWAASQDIKVFFKLISLHQNSSLSLEVQSLVVILFPHNQNVVIWGKCASFWVGWFIYQGHLLHFTSARSRNMHHLYLIELCLWPSTLF